MRSTQASSPQLGGGRFDWQRNQSRQPSRALANKATENPIDAGSVTLPRAIGS
jgi:hypothetical protein